MIATGANNPADGFSINYGDAILGELGQAEEGMAGGQATENISFEVDTWQNFDAEQELISLVLPVELISNNLLTTMDPF